MRCGRHISSVFQGRNRGCADCWRVLGGLSIVANRVGRRFTEVGLHHVNAHGHGEMFGWVGLFVMGFAYQAFPRFKHTSFRWPQLAATTLVMMLAAIVLRSISEPLVAAVVWTYWLVLLGAVIEVLAAILFCTVIAERFPALRSRWWPTTTTLFPPWAGLSLCGL